MSLNYELPAIKSAPDAEARYKALPECMKQFNHNILPFVLMVVGITSVTPITIPTIIARYKFASSEEFYRIGNELRKAGITDWTAALNMLIGFHANVSTETEAQWIKRMLQHEKTDLPRGYKSHADLTAAINNL